MQIIATTIISASQTVIIYTVSSRTYPLALKTLSPSPPSPSQYILSPSVSPSAFPLFPLFKTHPHLYLHPHCTSPSPPLPIYTLLNTHTHTRYSLSHCSKLLFQWNLRGQNHTVTDSFNKIYLKLIF